MGENLIPCLFQQDRGQGASVEINLETSFLFLNQFLKSKHIICTLFGS